MSTRPMTLWCSCVPRPVLPMKPTACESSTMTIALCFSARSQIAGRFAMEPSIEKTPSVVINRKRAVEAAFSLVSRSDMLPF